MKNEYIIDFIECIKSWPSWYYYGLQDIKNKYTRSVFGPFWISISIAVTIFAMGPLYSMLFRVSNNNNNIYYIHLSSGLIFWYFISGTISDSCTAFISNESFIKQTKLPLFVYIARLIIRNQFILIHNLFILALIIFFQSNITFRLLLLIPNLLIVTAILFLLSYILAVICTRFRDLVPLIGSLLQLSMFLTPIFWIANESIEKSHYLYLNPFNYIMQLLRNPIENKTYYSLYILGFEFFIVLFIISFIIHHYYNKKISYWL
jgi:lipopolysaccharide transport system permease protein